MGNKVCEGTSARIVGVLLILTPIVSFGSTFLYGVVEGIGMASSGQTQLTKLKQDELEKTGTIISLGVFAVMFMLSMIVAFMTAKPPKRRTLPPDDLLLESPLPPAANEVPPEQRESFREGRPDGPRG